MKVGYFSLGQARFIGAVVDHRVFNLTAAAWQGDHPFLQDLTTLITSGNFRAELLESLYQHGSSRAELWYPMEEVSFLPLFRPGKIICLGMNYADHAREIGRAKPEEPIYFEKAASSIIAHSQSIVCPAGIGRVDPEAELAIIIGKEARGVDVGAAGSFIAGYTILNDVTARDMQQQDMGKRQPWYRSKSIDTFCPMGPWIVTTDEIQPEDVLRVQLRVNGEVRQDGITSDLVFSVPALIAQISSLITLEAGDVISTGTPSGIAPIHSGDVVEIEIERIGILTNPVISSAPHDSP
jgi:5-oxopent-3-ene-1,2,5-tricarboxylate decarboxylase / 2-hydroxyhepta-2,4-diene-1,7-dioate isomerase